MQKKTRLTYIDVLAHTARMKFILGICQLNFNKNMWYSSSFHTYLLGDESLTL